MTEIAVQPQTISLMLVVAVALVDDCGRVLVQQRPAGKSMAGLWEFPGGKVEKGEMPEAALVRELDEELGIEVEIADLAPLTFASEELGSKHLVLLLYTCREWKGEPRAHAADALLWANSETLTTLAMPPADVPLVAALARQLS